jgi:YD repeat-containing protein
MRIWLRGIACLVLSISLSAWAGDTHYVYDENGRVVGVIDTTTNQAVEYRYDEVGNILQVVSSAAVTIFDFTPDGGPVGSQVTLRGKGFSATAAQNTVKFNGVTASIGLATTETLVVTVPVGATTGTISVTSPSGTATTATAFQVGSGKVPTITSFSPAILPIGGNVIINGSNFDTTISRNQLGLNQQATPVVSATATQLIGKVGNSSSSGKVSIATAYGRAQSSADLFVTPSPYVATDVAVAQRIALDTAIPVTLPAGKIGLLVFDPPTNGRIAVQSSGNLAGGTGNQAAFTLRRANRSVVITGNKGSGNLFIDTQALNPPTNQLEVIPGTGYSGTLSITVGSVPNDLPAVGITINGGSGSVTTTKAGQGLAGFTFNNTVAGQRVTFTLSDSSGSCSTYVIRRPAPDSTVLKSGGNCNSPANPLYIDTQILNLTGMWTIEVDPGGSSFGTFTARVDSVPADLAGALTLNATAMPLTFSKSGQNATYTFSVPTSQLVTIRVTGNTINYPTITLKSGTTTITSTSNSSASFNLAQQTLASGSYTVEVDPAGAATGTLNLQATSP